MDSNMYRFLYKDENIEINMIMDDEGERPLTYWYRIKNIASGKVMDKIDVRELKSFLQFFDGKKPSIFQLICRRTENIPEIIKLAINNHELD